MLNKGHKDGKDRQSETHARESVMRAALERVDSRMVNWKKAGKET
jgi:hypothetical protein